MVNPFDLTGKKYIVTGASSGIGRCTAVKLSECGAKVILIARREDKLRETLDLMSGDGHQIFALDLSQAIDISAAFNEMVADGKKLDGIVHSAASAPVLPIAMVTGEKIEEAMRLNLYSFIDMIRIFMKKKYHEAEGGSLVAVSSVVVDMPSKCQTIYAATKGALNSAVKTLAMELAEKKVRINCVVPASTDTQMMRDAILDMPEEVLKRKMETQVLGVTKPEDVASSIIYLLSDASRAMTGRSLYADGGYLGI